MRRLTIALIIFIVCCQPIFASNNPISIQIHTHGSCVFGKSIPLSITVKNESQRALCITGIDFSADNAQAPITSINAKYGSLDYKRNEDAYEYDTMRQQATPKVFCSMFLLPGDSITQDIDYRPLDTQDILYVHYIASVAAYNGTYKSLDPLRIYIAGPDNNAGMTIPYRQFTAAGWNETRKNGDKQHREDVLLMNKSDDAIVHIRKGASTRLSPAIKTIDLPIRLPLSGKPFTATAARYRAARIMKTNPSRVRLTYCHALGGYVIEQGASCWILHNEIQQKQRDILSAFPLTMAAEIDKTGVSIRVGKKQKGFVGNIKKSGLRFWNRYPIRYGDGMYTNGEFITITSDQIRDFLHEVMRSHGSLETVYYFFGSHYYQLHLP